MPSRKLMRSTYRDPLITTNPPFQRDSTCGENAVDMEDFYTPLFDVHGSGAHDWGVAEGLAVRATSGSPNLTVTPGIAIDAAGKHISLAEGGSAEIGANPETSPADLALVAAAGVTIPTAGHAGTKYVVTRWWESFDDDLYNLAGRYRFNHTPWIRLVNVAGFADVGVDIVLAKATIDAAGKVTGLDETLRRNLGLSAETIQIRRGERVSGSPNFDVDSKTAGTIHPRAGGGLEMTVPGSGDQIDVERDGGGTFHKLSVAADRLVVRRNDGKETVIFDGSDAWLRLGASGVEGDIVIKDKSDREAIALNGQTAAVHIGTTGNEGDLNLRNTSNQKTIRMDGATGDIWFRGALKDIDGLHSGITHETLKDLTDGGTSSAHKHTNSGNTTRPRHLWMTADDGPTVETISFSSSRRVFAYIAITSMDPRHDFDRGDAFFAEVYRVNGSDARGFGWSYGGDHLGASGSDANVRAPLFIGNASRIDFRLRSMQDAWVTALAVVFPEFV